MTRALVVAGLAALAVPALAAEPCGPDAPATTRRSARCDPPRFEREDDGRARAGSRPGFIDLGNGTEVQVSGRARLDYGTRR